MMAPQKLDKRTLMMLRAAKTASETKYNLGGTEKNDRKPVSIANIKFDFNYKDEQC